MASERFPRSWTGWPFKTEGPREGHSIPDPQSMHALWKTNHWPQDWRRGKFGGETPLEEVCDSMVCRKKRSRHVEVEAHGTAGRTSSASQRATEMISRTNCKKLQGSSRTAIEHHTHRCAPCNSFVTHVLTNPASYVSDRVSISLPYRSVQDRSRQMVRLTVARRSTCATSERADIQTIRNTVSATTLAAQVASFYVRCAIRPLAASACPRQDLGRRATSTKQDTRPKTVDSFSRTRRVYIQAFCIPREWRPPSSCLPPVPIAQSVPGCCFVQHTSQLGNMRYVGWNIEV